MNRTGLFFGIVGAMALAAASVSAQMAGTTSPVIASRLQAEGTVDRIDHAQRTMTLRLSTGERLDLHVSPQAAGFDDVKRGDPVTVDYLEAVSVSLEPGSGPANLSAARQSQAATQSQAGSQQRPVQDTSAGGMEMEHAKPGSPSVPTEGEAEYLDEMHRISAAGDADAPVEAMVRTEEVTAPVQSIDQAANTVTLRTPEGPLTLLVPHEAGDINALRPGDRITTRYTQALALDVRPGR